MRYAIFGTHSRNERMGGNKAQNGEILLFVKETGRFNTKLTSRVNRDIAVVSGRLGDEYFRWEVKMALATLLLLLPRKSKHFKSIS